MKQKIILLLLATLTPIGIFTRFEYLLFLSFLLFILFSVSCLNNNFENNLKILKNKFNLALAIVFIIVAISYYNPNYKVLEANGYYTLDKLSHIALLPTSVKSSVGNKGLIYFVLFWINMFYFVNAILLNATNKKNAFFFIICTNIIGSIAAIYLIWEEYYFFKEGIANLFTNRIVTLTTIITVLVSLLIIGVFNIVSFNIVFAVIVSLHRCECWFMLVMFGNHFL